MRNYEAIRALADELDVPPPGKYGRKKVVLAGISLAFYCAVMLLLPFPYVIVLGSLGTLMWLQGSQSRLIRIGVLCAMSSFPFGVRGCQTIAPTTESQGSQVNPAGPTRIDYGMPERLGRQVAPSPSAPWRSPDLSGYTSVLKSAERSPIDPEKHYELVELIDLAQRMNPETRVEWEVARQAAIGVGLVESEYFPVLALSALGGYQSEAFPAPKNVAPSGFFRANLEQVLPALNLRWLLLDFGRRGNSLDAAKERLLSANLGFNRKHQEIIFRVQRAFLGLTSLRAKIAVAQSSLDSARAVRESAEAQLRNGLATLPEVSLARQQEAQAAFDLEDVLATERDAQVGLAESIGIPPTTQIQVTDFSSLPPPAALEDSVEKVIDQALDRRPDLIAKVAALRGKEAEVRRARAAYFPTLSLVSNFNTIVESSPEGRILCPRFGDKFQMGALINMPGAVHMPLT